MAAPTRRRRQPTAFRFQDCPCYKRASGTGLCEMDHGWLDADGVLWLVEVVSKPMLAKVLAQPLGQAQESQQLLAKVTHSLLMLGAAWAHHGSHLCARSARW